MPKNKKEYDDYTGRVVDEILRIQGEKGWSIKVMAERCGIGYMTLRNILAERHMPTLLTVRKICEGCMVPPSRILFPELQPPEDDSPALTDYWTPLDDPDFPIYEELDDFALADASEVMGADG